MDEARRQSSIANLPAWFNERFPIVNFVSAFVMFWMLATAARAILQISPVLQWNHDFASAMALACFFLLMRVSDEFKDYTVDLALFPNRILQSGLIELKHLRYVAGFAIVFMAGVSFAHRGLAPWFCLLNLVFVALLNREFFCGPWLRSHILLYALSHMLVAITSSLWVLSLLTPNLEITPALLVLLCLPYCSGMLFEFTRKTFGTEENREGLESYSLILGVKTSVLALTLTLIITEVCFAFVLQNIFPNHFIFGLCLSLALAFFAVVGIFKYAKQPTKKHRKINEAVIGLLILGNYLTIVGLALWN